MTTLMLEVPPAAPSGLVSLDGRTYPLESARVQGRAEGGLAMTTLHQRFRNPYREALEVRYTLPLPADGAVLGYTITVGERRIVGEVQSREAADEAYRQALYEGRTAGLLEQDRSDTFQQQLGNIPGGTAVEVEIRVLHPLAFRPGEEAGGRGPARDGSRSEWEYRFPTTVGVRYMGAPGRVSDAGRLDPERGEGGVPARLTLSMTVADSVDSEAVRSPSHQVRSFRDGDGLAIELREPAPLDRDVVLRWEALGADVGVRLVEGRGLEGDDGRYALITVLPPRVPEATHARDLTVLLDTSGSMHGSPLSLAKAVVGVLLRDLEDGDRVELLSFGSTVVPLTDGAVDATPDTIRALLRKLEGLRASGGTEMRHAVSRALRPLRNGAQRQVVLVTDGYIGFEGEVVAEAMTNLPEGVRFHAVGVGSAPNRTLTGGLARAGRGLELFAQDEASADECASLLAAATARPVLAGLSVSGGGVVEVAPARPRDVMAGQPVVLTAELAPEGGWLEVVGELAGARDPWRWTIELPASVEAEPDPSPFHPPGALPGTRIRPGALRGTPIPLGALHGREMVADLELKEAAGASRHSVDAEIEARALRHRIVSRRTSLVAISETPTVDPRAPRRRERLAVELPAGVSAEGVGLVRGSLASQAMLTRRSFGVSELHTLHGMAFDLDAGDETGPLASGAYDSVLRDELPSARPPAAPGPGEPDRGPGRRKPPRPIPHPGARKLPGVELIAVDGDLLVVEFETPAEGFMAPRGKVSIKLANGEIHTGRIDHPRSTERGPHPAGLRIRLAVRMEKGSEWPRGSRVRVSWLRVGVSGPGGKDLYALSVSLPRPDREARR